MQPSPRFLTTRPAKVHAARPWSQFSHVSREIERVVRDLSAAGSLRTGQTVLDYGSATSPYRALFPGEVSYLAADLPGNALADLELRPDGTVPLPDHSCDVVLSTQVLEHVEDPDLYVAECARLLNDTGSLVLSTHGIMYYHRDPEDYWRWTMAGLTRLLSRHGLDVVERRGVLGLPATGLQLFQDGLYHSLPRPARPLFALLMQLLVKVADRRSTAQAREENGMVIAVRAVRRTGSA
ncbi:MAG: methyltransferase domain-containing protein [Streptomyces sp.]|uniref:methyltransferase domain-containing protein n=1 Tax=Streptomyces sp. TaxID=1931 RepID=UPI0025DCDC11|nr:methyltransferase domain-containing protein [Streptomyces sp.]MBW8792225.1 methyltransferase domain-containing protein [Streptomyces sp.]